MKCHTSLNTYETEQNIGLHNGKKKPSRQTENRSADRKAVRCRVIQQWHVVTLSGGMLGEEGVCSVERFGNDVHPRAALEYSIWGLHLIVERSDGFRILKLGGQDGANSSSPFPSPPFIISSPISSSH